MMLIFTPLCVTKPHIFQTKVEINGSGGLHTKGIILKDIKDNLPIHLSQPCFIQNKLSYASEV